MISYKSIGWVLVVASVGIHAFFLWSVRGRIARADPDFTSFYGVGKIVRDGRGAELYDFQTQQQTQAEFSSNADIRKGPLAYIHPPYEALLFVPLTFLPYTAAFAVWGGLNLLVLFLICRLLRDAIDSFRTFPVWQMVVLCWAFFPVLANFHQGQDALLLLLIVVIAFRNVEGNRDFVAGCWLGLGIFKYHLVIPLTLILVIWRGRKLLMGFAVVACANALASVAVVGWRGAIRYPAFVWQVVSEPRYGGLPLRRVPDLLGLIAGWQLAGKRSWPVEIAVIAASLALLTMAVRLKPERATGQELRLCFSCAVIVAVLLAYCTNTYDLVLLILPLGLIADHWLTRSRRDMWSRVVAVFPATVICLSPMWFLLWMRWDRINVMGFFLLWWFFAIRNEILGQQPNRESAKQVARI